ncbi:toxic anion resistance protein [Serratia sp. S1B]|nr:toxic anion resistance protein [Serratia sp. S1B]
MDNNQQLISSTSIQNPQEGLPETYRPDPVQVTALASQINIAETGMVMGYGAKPMAEIAQFADTLLHKIKARDGGEVGQLLSDLVLRIRENDPFTKEEKSSNFLASLPVVGKLFKQVEQFKVNNQALTEQVDTIANHLDQSMITLMRDIETLEQLYLRNFNFYNEVTLYIDAGKQKLQHVSEIELPALKQEADTSKNLMMAQQVKDMIENINRFERRLHDLDLSRTIAIQTAPQIRMVQSTNQQLAEKIQSSILATLPIWKSQMVLSMTLNAQSKAARLQKEVSDTTNQLLLKNAEILQQSSIATANEVERSIVDVGTLREVQNKLINTIEETMKIADNARTRRAEAETELATMEENLRLRLTEATSRYK